MWLKSTFSVTLWLYLYCRCYYVVHFVKTFQFDGSQIASLRQRELFGDASDSVDRDSLNLQFSFWNYWNDAPILLIADQDKNPKEFMALILRKTKLYLIIKTLNGQEVEKIMIDKRLNTASWVDVAVTRDSSETTLKVSMDGRVVGTASTASEAMEDLLFNPVVQFGGFEFNQAQFKKMAIPIDAGESKRFLGAMKGIKLNGVDIDLGADSSSDRPKEGFKPSEYVSSTFPGKGHILLTMNKLSLDADFVISFGFAATNLPEGRDGILLLARNGKSGYFSVALVDGKVESRFRVLTAPEVLLSTSSSNHNSGARKLVEIRFNSATRRFSMNVDGENANSEVMAGADGSIDVTRLFVGGYPDNFAADNVVALPHYKSLLGYVDNVKIGSAPMQYPFGTPPEFVDADIGRKYLPRPAPEGNCAAPRELVQVGNALRFGDHRTSRAVINPYDVIGQDMAESFKRQFTFTFSFRTFYRNGILFYMEPKNFRKNKEVYITAYLMDGNVVLNFKQPKVAGQRTDQKGLMTEGDTYADGKFHRVQIIKNGKTISMQVDDGPVMESKMKKSSENVDWSEKLKIGGPRTSMPFKVILYPLQGCIKEFRINDKLANMAADSFGDNRHAKPCESPADGDLVRGAHFSGQGYARLNDIFVIDDWLQIKLKFKTTSPEGVLLAIGDPDEPRRPTLMLELFKGDLILRLQTLSGLGQSMVVFNSTYNKFEEGAQACDNEWHSVDARVVRTVLMLIVDGRDGVTGFKSDAQQKHSGEIKQYVGGIPDNLRSTWPLKPLSSKNFRGCVSDVMIKDYEKYEDSVVWSLSSSSLKIHQVDISACP